MEFIGLLILIILLFLFFWWMKGESTGDTSSFEITSSIKLPITSKNISQNILEKYFAETVDDFVKVLG
jgi:hypothetical protein|tara:strand:- start:239 stop:442 length:204 start_codon:yes stop_codon:yes gene_type:complete